MLTLVQSYVSSAESAKRLEGVYLGLGCVGMCIFALTISLKFPGIAEALTSLG